MGPQKPKGVNASPIISPIRGGTGTAELAPPWSRKQVQWHGRGYYVLRLATEETSRWVLGASFRWNDVFPHERTFKRSASDKATVMATVKMNPWPAHLASAVNPNDWRTMLSGAVEGLTPLIDTGHVTLWRAMALPRDAEACAPMVVLDGHHSRKAQHYLGLGRVFGWLEPLEASQLTVRAIHRCGWLAKWIDELLARGELKIIEREPAPDEWSAESSQAFEVLQSGKRFWCELTRPQPHEAAVDGLARLAKGQAFLKASSSFDEIMEWLSALEIDTAIRMPPPSKRYVYERALSRRLFPQKATYFFPKIPFGLLVADLAASK